MEKGFRTENIASASDTRRLQPLLENRIRYRPNNYAQTASRAMKTTPNEMPRIRIAVIVGPTPRRPPLGLGSAGLPGPSFKGKFELLAGLELRWHKSTSDPCSLLKRSGSISTNATYSRLPVPMASAAPLATICPSD